MKYLCIADPMADIKGEVPQIGGVPAKPVISADTYTEALKVAKEYTDRFGIAMIVFEAKVVARTMREAVVREILEEAGDRLRETITTD